jgi:hypothetical protein
MDPVAPVGPTDNRVTFAVVPGRTVVGEDPSTWKLSVSPATRSRNIRRGSTMGDVAIVMEVVQ